MLRPRLGVKGSQVQILSARRWFPSWIRCNSPPRGKPGAPSAPQILENVHRGYHGQAPDNLTERTAANTHKHAAFFKVRPPKQPRPFLFFSSKALFGDSVPGRGATLFPSRVMPEAAQGAAGRKNRTGVRRGAPNQKRFRNFPFCFCVEAVMLGAAASDLETVCVCCCSFLGRVTGRAVRGDPWQVKKRV